MPRSGGLAVGLRLEEVPAFLGRFVLLGQHGVGPCPRVLTDIGDLPAHLCPRHPATDLEAAAAGVTDDVRSGAGPSSGVSW
ncbi:hypothetical protein P3T29_001618 [Kitasatospora sp. MAP5-34]|nr:hypothetical protein [Kitasatospora sp. MAP5-34]